MPPQRADNSQKQSKQTAQLAEGRLFGNQRRYREKATGRSGPSRLRHFRLCSNIRVRPNLNQRPLCQQAPQHAQCGRPEVKQLIKNRRASKCQQTWWKRLFTQVVGRIKTGSCASALRWKEEARAGTVGTESSLESHLLPRYVVAGKKGVSERRLERFVYQRPPRNG